MCQQLGKKKLKAIARSLRNVNQTPRSIFRRGSNQHTPTPFDTAPKYAYLNRAGRAAPAFGQDNGSVDLRSAVLRRSIIEAGEERGGGDNGVEDDIAPEEQPLRGKGNPRGRMTRYGSIIGSPPTNGTSEVPQGGGRNHRPPSLELPGPALPPHHDIPQRSSKSQPTTPHHARPASSGAVEAPNTKTPTSAQSLPSRYRSIFRPKRINSMQDIHSSKPFLKRFASFGPRRSPHSPARANVPVEYFRELDFSQAEFFRFLDMELEKIDDFYREKEAEATERLKVLREQLHIMRDRRLEELISIQTSRMASKTRKQNRGANGANGHAEDQVDTHAPNGGQALSNAQTIASWRDTIDSALDQSNENGKLNKRIKAMAQIGSPTIAANHPPDNRRDYIRRKETSEIPYTAAKRKLKLAMQEYYRGLELLKSYALLNRTAFRKINKKYDKTVNAKPSGRYMAEKVNRAYFVHSAVLDGHLRAVEDLYARYFEGGNHKVAVGKLRIASKRAGDYTDSTFRNGLALASGALLIADSLVRASQTLYYAQPPMPMHTSYLLQVSDTLHGSSGVSNANHRSVVRWLLPHAFFDAVILLCMPRLGGVQNQLRLRLRVRHAHTP